MPKEGGIARGRFIVTDSIQALAPVLEPPFIPIPPATAEEDLAALAYAISHDLRASVRALRDVPVWIAEDIEASGLNLPDEVSEDFALLLSHTRRLDRMLLDLLTFSRVGRMQRTSEISVTDALDNAIEACGPPPGFVIERQLEVEKLVIGHRDLDALLTALVENTFAHHDRSTGLIRVATQDSDGHVVISVADDGPGIEPIFQDRVFEMMTTLLPRDTTEFSGMGLAVVRKIAAHYGGSIRLRSAPPERGTTVEVRLPVVAETA